MRRISEADRDALRSTMPELLRLRFGVESVNRPFSCPSPEHDDRTPSARYYENGHTVHCFGCQRTWDVFTLIGEVDGIEGFAAQAEAVAEIVGYRLNESVADPKKKRYRGPVTAKQPEPFPKPKKAGGPEVSDICFRAYSNLYLYGCEEGRRWLRGRGLDDSDIVRHGLGFCFDPRRIMGQFRIYEPSAAGYVVIPFWSQDGGSCNYAMVRTISHGYVRNKEWRPKGVVSPLYKEWMLSSGLPVVYVTEGLIDAMALEKIIGKPVMALGGTSYANRLAQVLAHTEPSLRPRRIVIAMDSDVAGRKARDKIAADLDKIGVRHSDIPPYPSGCKDADDWLMAGEGKEWRWEAWPMGGVDETHTFWKLRWADGR